MISYHIIRKNFKLGLHCTVKQRLRKDAALDGIVINDLDLQEGSPFSDNSLQSRDSESSEVEQGSYYDTISQEYFVSLQLLRYLKILPDSDVRIAIK